MDIIQALKDLQSFVEGMACRDIEYCTLPPQHGFSEGSTVESVI